MNTTKLIASCIVCALLGAPTVSVAKARGGGGGYSSGSRTSSSGSVGSRGSRTYDQNGAKPVEQSTTPRPATAPQPTASSPAPTAQPAPSFLQRHPLLSGIAAGAAGSWIGHMLFGATDSSAKSTEAGEASQTAGGFNVTGMLLLMLLAGGTLYYLFKMRRTPAPVFSGVTQRRAVGGALLAEASASSVTLRTGTVDTEVTSADKTAFQQLLIDIQTAWGKQDLVALRRFVTPEMLAYFSTALAEQNSQELENHVEDVVLVQAEVQESWIEDSTQFATAKLCWTARDYTVSLTKQRGEPGFVVEGSEEKSTETSEVWTFMRYQNGKWLLSAIQQVA